MSYDYSENILVQESAGHLLQNELGWEVAFAYNTEKLGEDGTFGRKSYKEILLTRYFREALLRLNPWITPAQIDEAQRKLEHRLSTASLLQINEEKYFLIRDGIPVTVKKPGGKTEEKRAAVIDFQNPDNNRFLAIKELKIHGDLYRRRTDIVGFVNGILSPQRRRFWPATAFLCGIWCRHGTSRNWHCYKRQQMQYPLRLRRKRRSRPMPLSYSA